MFCQGCGAELDARALACGVCGRPPSAEARVLARETSAAPAAISPVATIPRAPSITEGDLDAPGLPRDTPGRLVLVLGIALAVDLLLPWVRLNDVAVSPAALGVPAVCAVLVLFVGVSPAVSPSVRRHPAGAALPLAAGGIGAGMALTVLLMLNPLAQFAVRTASGSDIGVSPRLGLYLFLVGSLGLAGAGYAMLHAERESVLSAALEHRERTASTSGVTRSLAAAVTLVEPSAAQEVAAHAGVSGPLRISADRADVNASRREEPEPAPPVAPLALPGSEAWTRAPSLPAITRPTRTRWGGRTPSPR